MCYFKAYSSTALNILHMMITSPGYLYFPTEPLNRFPCHLPNRGWFPFYILCECDTLGPPCEWPPVMFVFYNWFMHLVYYLQVDSRGSMGPPSFWFLLIILTFWQATKPPSSRHRHSTPWGQGQAPGRHTPCFCLIDESSHHQAWKRTYVHEWKRKRLEGKWEGLRTKVPEVDMNSSV